MALPADIAESLTMEEIPVKLRCAACNQLANNAFRMPCCDQSICGNCQASLPQACPVCLHEPVKADDCRPNKALRTTIKVFLKKKGIEREAARKQEAVEKVAATPTNTATLQQDAASDIAHFQTSTAPALKNLESKTDRLLQLGDGSQKINSSKASSAQMTLPNADQKDIPRPSIETANGDFHNGTSQDNTAEGNGVQVNGNTIQEKNGEQRVDEQEMWPTNSTSGQVINNSSFGFEPTNGGFPSGMGFNGAGEFGQLMPFIPNSIQANPMSGFPNMMTMPGMGMDQMVMSQGMYGGFGGQGMGMNGMNGMNIGMGYNAGQNAFGGFNGQPAAWNAGHDKFNQNGYGHATGMGGEFGTNAGYGRYNMPQHQGNFNQMNHHQYQNNDFQSGYNGQGFQNRGRGRGRGYQNAGRGRGGYHQVNHGNQANYEPFHHQIPQQLTQQEQSAPQPSTDLRKTPEQQKPAPTNPPKTPDAQSSTQQAAEDLAKELEPGDVKDAKDALEKDTKASPPAEASSGENFELVTKAPEITTDDTKQHGAENPDPAEIEKPSPIEAFVPSHPKEPDVGQINGIVKAPAVMMPPPTPTIPLGPAALYSVDQQQESPLRGGGAGRGLHRGGHGYHSLSRGRSTSYGSNSIVTPLPSPKPIPTADTTTPAPVELKGLGVEGAPKAPKALRDGLPNIGLRGRGFSIVGRASSVTQARPNGHIRSRSASPARSRSASRHQSHKHRTHRHRSTSSSSESDRDRRRERHRRHTRNHEDADTGKLHDQKGSNSREKSAESSPRRSSHRSHREHGKTKDAGRSSHRSHRSHRDRSRGREGESRSSRKRSKSPGGETGAVKKSEANPPQSPTDSRRKDKHDESSHSSRKRDRGEEDEDRHRDRDRDRDRKRSRRDRSPEVEDKENHPSSRHTKRSEADTKSSHEQKSKMQDRAPENIDTAPKKSETDHHTLEREARNRERLLKELQRREAMEGKGSSGSRKEGKVESKSGAVARRVSYKYEDEESSEARNSRVESEREAGRWR